MAAVTDILKMTPAEFEAYATTPDNADADLKTQKWVAAASSRSPF